MSSDFADGYVPDSPTSFARPVQDEDATLGLTGCETPDGHGVLCWNTSTEARSATVSSPLDFIVDDIVPSSDFVDILPAPVDYIYGVSAFSAVGETFCVVQYNDGNHFYSEVYIADSPNDPTSWSYYSTIYDRQANTFSSFGNGQIAGTPLILDSGRWVIATKTQDGPGLFFSVWSVRFFTSDDDGATWDFRQWEEHFVFPAGRLEYASGNIAHDPISGDIFFRSGTSISSADMNIPWRSQDDGVTWAKGLSNLSAPEIIPFAQNGTTLYAMSQRGGHGIYYYDGSGNELTDWIDTGEVWLAPGATGDGPYDQATHGTVTSLGVFFFVRDQVMYTPLTPGGAWHFNVRWTT